MSSNNHAAFIWSVADLLRGSFKAHQYGDIILPFTVLRRLGSGIRSAAMTTLANVTSAVAVNVQFIAQRAFSRTTGFEFCRT